MNPHTPSTTPPYTNGHYETPLAASGVSPHPQASAHKPTVFPPDLPLADLGSWLYGLHRFHLGGVPASRYIALLWLAIALLAALNALPGRWITMSIALLLWAGQFVLGLRHRKQHYVSFTSAPLPALNHTPLETSEKLPIYATGLLSVEGRYQQYSALPGFYRTFATGEHAVLCLVQERRWLGFLTWPADETGMWYAFVQPTDIQRLTWGNLRFGNKSFPAVAIDYRLEIPPSSRRKEPEIRQETLYLAALEMDDAKRMYVDLLTNLPSEHTVTTVTAAP